MKRTIARLGYTLVLASLLSPAAAAVFQVQPGHNTLPAALEAANSGDTLVLLDGVYSVDANVSITKNMTITAADDTVAPKIALTGNASAFTAGPPATEFTLRGVEINPQTSCVLDVNTNRASISDNTINCRLRVLNASEYTAIVGNRLNFGHAVDTGGTVVIAGNDIVHDGLAIKFGQTGLFYDISTSYFRAARGQYIGNRVIVDVTASTNYALYMLAGTYHVIANRFEVRVPALASGAPNLTGLYAVGAEVSFQNNIIRYTLTEPAGAATPNWYRPIHTTSDTPATISNNIIIGAPDLQVPASAADSHAILVEGVARVSNNVVMTWPMQAISSPFLADVNYNICFDVASFGECTTGAQNLQVDPQFAETVDFTLAAGSPAINSGRPALNLNDLDGSRGDIGVYGGPIGFSQYDQQRGSTGTPFIYPLFDQIRVSRPDEITIEAISVARP